MPPAPVAGEGMAPANATTGVASVAVTATSPVQRQYFITLLPLDGKDDALSALQGAGAMGMASAMIPGACEVPVDSEAACDEFPNDAILMFALAPASAAPLAVARKKL